jgi:putative MATE family efflux protein
VIERIARMSDVSNERYDLTQGRIFDRLIAVALPIIGTQLVLMSYNLVDMFLLGRVGSEAVAAAGMAGMYMWLSNGVLLIGRMGAEIGVAQNLGGHDEEAARKFSSNSIFLAVSTGMAFAVACRAFSSSLIGFFNIKEAHVARSAVNYLSIVSLGMPLTFVSAAAAGTFNGSGNSRVPFLINSAGLVLNAALDPIFIFSLGLGVEGAAVATVIAQAAGCSMSLLALKKKKDRPFERYIFFMKPELRYITRILRWSVPIAIESMLFTFFTLVVSRIVAGFGAGAIAVYRVGTYIESLCWLTCIGVSTAVTAFVGQNYGARKWERIGGCCRISLAASCSWGAFVMVLFLTAGGHLFRFFLPDPVLIDEGRSFMRIIAICQVFGCLEAVSSGVFRGFGRTLPPSVVSVVCNALRIPISYALSMSSLGINGIWLGVTITASLRGAWVFVWFLLDIVSRLRGSGRKSASDG